jgi:flagellar biosynthesis protein FlhG
MPDQAESLRRLLGGQKPSGSLNTKVITVTSGKGGVGKSNFTLNFALSLQALGRRTLIFDADIGLSNIDVLTGMTPKYNLYHLLKRQKTIWDIIYTAQHDLQIISGGSGFGDLFRLSEEDLDEFTGQISELNGHVDYIIFDTGAGLSKETLKFILAAEETIVITTPEPTAITDAYAVIKMVHAIDSSVSFRLVVNRVSEWSEGKRTADKIGMVARQFLDLDIPLLGCIEDDPNVSKAVKKQIPFSIAYPHSPASRSVRRIAASFSQTADGGQARPDEQAGIKGFLSRMLHLIR